MGAADAPPGAFGVGVLRRDGILIPFAAFDGKRWRSPWPQPQALNLVVPINLASVPARWWGPTGPLDTWQAWIGSVARSVRVVQPDWAGIHCARQIGLRTDYTSDEVTPPLETQPFPKDGLVVSPAQPIEPIENIPVDSPAATRLADAVLDAFNKAERQTENRFGHPMSRRTREKIAPTLEAVYAAGQSPRAYYVEAVRPYREMGTPATECEVLAVGTGWFVGEGDTVRPLVMTVDVLNCDRRGASYMLPLGALHIANRLFWFAQFSGWDHERYVVVEVTPKAAQAVVSAWGGGC